MTLWLPLPASDGDPRELSKKVLVFRRFALGSPIKKARALNLLEALSNEISSEYLVALKGTELR